jgi:hypothetical protein
MRRRPDQQAATVRRREQTAPLKPELQSGDGADGALNSIRSPHRLHTQIISSGLS